jgi:glutathione reductase (NADPH)
MSTYDYDLFVIGAGSGGLATSKRAASYGAHVAIAEADRVGGTCVIRGCIPKKLMVYAAEHGHAHADAAGYGWSGERGSLDWNALVTKRDRSVEALERTHEGHLERAGVELLRGRASIRGANEVEIDGRRITSRYILISTGGRPLLPKLDGIDAAITSDGFFELKEQPGRMLIVGGGYIAVEFASIMSGLGSKVTLAIRRDRPLRGFDEDLRTELLAALRAAGVDVRVETTVRALRRDGDTTLCSLVGRDGEEQLCVDKAVVYAVGRSPNVEGLGLENVGIELGPKREVQVDEQDRTKVPSIMAIGDVTERAPLTPVAIQAGRALADRLFGNKNTIMSYHDIPTAVFTEPPIGTVGMTTEQAIERYGADGVSVYRAGFNPLVHTLTDRKVRTFIKMIVHNESDRVLGCHMIGHDAPEIIQGLGVAMKAGATKADFDATVGIHPSTAEEFVTMV